MKLTRKVFTHISNSGKTKTVIDKIFLEHEGEERDAVLSTIEEPTRLNKTEQIQKGGKILAKNIPLFDGVNDFKINNVMNDFKNKVDKNRTH